LIDKNSCCGCSACHDICEQNAIEMCLDEEGFSYPFILEDRCISCGTCLSVCPITQFKSETSTEQPSSYIAWNNDDVSRKISSSGGIFSALAEKTISEGGVVVGAAFDEALYLRHSIASSIEEYAPMRGSKYLQSDTCGIYIQVLNKLRAGFLVLFTGTPCQISGLNSFLADKKFDKLITCEIFCHGVPSPGIFKEYIKYLETKNSSKIINYQFRSKVFGWHKPAVCVNYANGKKRYYRHQQCTYHNWFGMHYSIRPACYQCAFRSVERSADISIGDFWGIQSFRPDIDIEKGVSTILVTSEKGKAYLNKINKTIYLEECPMDWPIKKNQYLIKSYPVPALRAEFMSDFQTITMNKLVNKYHPTRFMLRVFQRLLRAFRIG
jgi:coenzyme F420-reducing hydrogenase beta subunit